MRRRPTLTLLVLCVSVLPGCMVLPLGANLFVSQDVGTLNLRPVSDGLGRVEIAWSARYGETGHALLLPSTLGTSTAEGSFSVAVERLGPACSGHPVFLGPTLLSPNISGSSGAHRGVARVDVALRRVRAESPEPECSVVLFTEYLDTPDGRIGYFVRAVSPYGEELGGFEVPREQTLTNRAKWGEVAGSPLLFVASIFDLGLFFVLGLGARI